MAPFKVRSLPVQQALSLSRRSILSRRLWKNLSRLASLGSLAPMYGLRSASPPRCGFCRWVPMVLQTFRMWNFLASFAGTIAAFRAKRPKCSQPREPVPVRVSGPFDPLSLSHFMSPSKPVPPEIARTFCSARASLHRKKQHMAPESDRMGLRLGDLKTPWVREGKAPPRARGAPLCYGPRQ